MAALRSFIGPFVVGLAVWCAAGDLTVADQTTATVRLAVPAAWWVFVVAAAGAAAVPGWRRRPVVATPALLATVPWWPLPMPAVGLVWTGPLAWLPIGIAACLALASPVSRATARIVAREPRAAVRLAGVLTLLAALATAWSVAPRLPGGDEPHYLVITQSLLLDGDLRIQNNHDRGDYRAYFGGTLRPDVIQRGRDGEVYSIHAPGTSVLVLPAFAVFGYRGAQAMVLLSGVLAAMLLWQATWLATRRTDAAWFAWAAVALTPTFLLQSVTLFPDGFGMLATAGGLWLIVRLGSADAPPVGVAPVVAVSAALAVLPWLHTRFAVIAGGLGLAIVVRLMRASGAGRVRRLVAFAVLPALAAIGWFAYFQLIYGTPSPAAPYGTDTSLTQWRFVPGGLAALVFDQQYGLLPYSPVLACWAVGLWPWRGVDASPSRTPSTPARRGAGAATWIGAGVTVAYLAAVAIYWMWWAGLPAPPARFAAAALPLVALPVGVAWARIGPNGRRLAVTLLLVSLATTAVVLGVDRGALAWNMRDAVARWLDWLGPVVDLARAWPSFFWRLDPADLSTEWPFVLASIVWLAVPLLLAAGLLRLAARGGWPGDHVRLACGWWVAAAVMATAQVGWTLAGASAPPPGVPRATALDPARSQLDVLRRAADGGPVWRLAALGVGRPAHAASLALVRPESPGRTDAPPPWLALAGVPAGAYQLEIVKGDGRGTTLVASLGRSAPVGQWAVGPGARQVLPLDLPAGADRLVIAPPDGAPLPPDAHVALRAVALEPMPGGRFAVAAARLGRATVLLLDDGVFVEPEGLWVRGGRDATFLVVGPAGQGGRLRLGNAPVPNDVRLVVDGAVVLDEAMAASASREVSLPATPDGRVLVSVRSSGGFRPSDLGGSEDRRYLGVRVELRDPAGR
ncbi:MAG: hypothetical protein R2752_12415 [Vicinamibacterales bacterium]